MQPRDLRGASCHAQINCCPSEGLGAKKREILVHALSGTREVIVLDNPTCVGDFVGNNFRFGINITPQALPWRLVASRSAHVRAFGCVYSPSSWQGRSASPPEKRLGGG